jgi:hypothetical protein
VKKGKYVTEEGRKGKQKEERVKEKEKMGKRVK